MEAENFFRTITEHPTLIAAPTAIHIEEEWYIGKALKLTRDTRNTGKKEIMKNIKKKPIAIKIYQSSERVKIDK